MKLKNELVLKTFEQFAVNQNSKENVFLKTLGFLGAVIIGFTYSYREFVLGKLEWSGFAYISTAAIILLGGGAWLIVAIGYSYRRDQYIINRIKRRAKLIGVDRIYPLQYNPLAIYFLKKGWKHYPENARKLISQMKSEYKNNVRFIYMRWMPDIFIIYYCLFPVFILFMMIVFIETTINTDGSYDVWKTPVYLFQLILLGLTLYLPFKYSRKLFRRLVIWHGLVDSPKKAEISANDWNEIERMLSVHPSKSKRQVHITRQFCGLAEPEVPSGQ